MLLIIAGSRKRSTDLAGSLTWMRVVESEPTAAVVELTTSELVLLSNALNEILQGPASIEDPEFHARTGATRYEGMTLLRALGRAIHSRPDYPRPGPDRNKA